MKNTYIDTSFQKGGVPGVLGCLEHMGVVTQLIQEARESKGDLTALWLDLTDLFHTSSSKLQWQDTTFQKGSATSSWTITTISARGSPQAK